MSENEYLSAFIFGLIFVGGFVGALVNVWWKDKLIDLGLAEYYLDNNNIRRWRIKPTKEST